MSGPASGMKNGFRRFLVIGISFLCSLLLITKFKQQQMTLMMETHDVPLTASPQLLKEKLDELEMNAFVETPPKQDNYRRFMSNVDQSRKIGIRRILPDTRHTDCKKQRHPTASRLPDVSVVIPFHNEDYSLLLRTVQSILDRTPEDLLREIILVDDNSSLKFLQKEFRNYITLHKKIQLIRLSERKGLIVARMIGAKNATGQLHFTIFGDVLVILHVWDWHLIDQAEHTQALTIGTTGHQLIINKDLKQAHRQIKPQIQRYPFTHKPVLICLDGHVEVNVGWLEPLVAEIHEHPTRIVMPHIDNIDRNTMEYTPSLVARGIFNWHLIHTWKELTPDEVEEIGGATHPIPSATMIGCVFAIRRDHFFALGAYDEAMLYWGGENMELSFKGWQCGNGLYIIPCSRVGHLWREYLPYSVPAYEIPENINQINRNLQRVAEVWMDSYKAFFYAATKYKPSLTDEEVKSLAERRAVRQTCPSNRDFHWYMLNIATDVYVPPMTAQFWGMVQNVGGYAWCLDGGEMIERCNYRRNTSAISLTSDGQLMMGNNWCLTVNGPNKLVKWETCESTPVSASQIWTFNQSAVRSRAQNLLTGWDKGRELGELVNDRLCLAQITDQVTDKQTVRVEPCDRTGQEPYNAFQIWSFEYSLLWRTDWIT